MQRFEDIFKSDSGKQDDQCPHCNGTGLSKSRRKSKKIGNEANPHRGPSGGQVKAPRGGKKGPVDRSTQPKNGLVKAMFPVNNGPLVSYSGSEDSVLAKSVEANLQNRYSDLHVPSQRNLAMEQEAARASAEVEGQDEGSDDQQDE